MLKQQLNIKLQQRLSPLQIQVIKMLEVPTAEMEERVREELEANPALEEGREESPDDDIEQDEQIDERADLFEFSTFGDDDDSAPDYYNGTGFSDEDSKATPLASSVSFQQYLIEQIELVSADKETINLAKYLIGNIDDDGYLRRSIDSMVDDLAFQLSIYITEKDLEKALEIVHQLDPIGVGARSLDECLLLQLNKKEYSDSVEIAKAIIIRCFDFFTKKQYANIIKRLAITESQLEDGLAEIIKLNPKPGNAFQSGSGYDNIAHITPDFTVENDEGKLILLLNRANVPELKISKSYNNMVKDFTGNVANQTTAHKEALLFAKQKIDSAKWFVEAIKQRNVTLMKTMSAIVDVQKEFFLDGDNGSMKPLKLKDIAELTGYDISTISRVVNSKYVETEFGVYSLKHFFSEAMMTDSGEEISNKEIKEVIKQVIESEDKQNPVADQELTEMLNKQGYQVARRTVAKYREALGLPVARLRKEF